MNRLNNKCRIHTKVSGQVSVLWYANAKSTASHDVASIADAITWARDNGFVQYALEAEVGKWHTL